MLPFSYCLKKNQEINIVSRHGKNITGGFIFLKFLNNHHTLNRFAFVVSLKISKKAVERNKIKRRMREIIQEEISQIKPGFDFLIIAKPGIINKNYKEIQDEIRSLFKKAKLYQ